MKLINRFGEIFHEKNETLATMPFERLGSENAEILEENYRSKVKELGLPDSFIYIGSFSVLRDRLQMTFDLDGCVAFHNIHKVKLRNMIPYLESMINIAKTDANILWEKSNFVIDTTEKKVKALLFEFDAFPLYKKDKNIDGLKELILLSLTNNKSIIAKPKRADFIEKTDEVYQFSEDILNSNTIEEIEKVVEGYENQKEHEERVADQQKREQAEKNLWNRTKSKTISIFSRKKEKSTEEQLKSDLSKNDNQKEKQKSFLDKLTTPKSMIVIGGLLVVFLLGFTFTDMNMDSADEEAAQKKQEEQNDKIKEAYRLYVAGGEENIDDAYAKLDAIGYDNLPDEDKGTLIDWYIEQEKFSKALKTTPDSAFAVSDEILEKHNIINKEEDDEPQEEDKEKAIDELESLETSFEENKILKFDIASLENDYSSIIENSDLPKINERRGKKIAQSYAVDNQYEELEKLMDDYRDDQDSYDNMRNYYDRYYEKNIEKEEALDEATQLKGDLEEKENDKESTEDKKDKKKIKKDIDKIEEEISEVEKNIKEIEESIKNDNEV